MGEYGKKRIFLQISNDIPPVVRDGVEAVEVSEQGTPRDPRIFVLSKNRRHNVNNEIKIPVPQPKLVLVSDKVEQMWEIGRELVPLKDKRNRKG